MAFGDLREFLARLESLGELHTVDAEVDPCLEIAEITDRHSKLPGGGKALRFAKVRGSAFPVLTNLFGSQRRMCAALEIAGLFSLTQRVERLLAREEAPVPPMRVTAAPCHEVVETSPDLDRYPFLKSWPGEGGRFITLPLVFTRDPVTGSDNCGMYRVRVFDGATVGVRWKKGSGGWHHQQKYAALGRRMPVAIAVGADPAVMLAATLPLPEPFDELSFAGFLRGAPVAMVRCQSCELSVPAAAELVIEGYLEPGETRPEGAFGNHTGFYDAGDDVPVLHVTCITRRRGMLYHATVVGPPPMEDCFMAKAAERIMLPFSRRQCPEIVDIELPMEGIFHGCAVVAIDKAQPGQGRQVLESLWAHGWLKRGKMIVVADAADGKAPLQDILWRTLNNAEFPRDLLCSEGRLGIDATRKLAGETGAQVPTPLAKNEAVSDLVAQRWQEYGFS